MDNLEDFEARVAQHRPIFFQLYKAFEELDKAYLFDRLKNKTILDIEDELKANSKPIITGKMFRSQERYDYLIYQTACVMKFFAVFGPGKSEQAWAFLVENFRSGLEGGEE